MAYEPVVYHGQQAFLRSYIRIERAKRAMLLERQFKKMVAIRIYAFSIRNTETVKKIIILCGTALCVSAILQAVIFNQYRKEVLHFPRFHKYRPLFFRKFFTCFYGVIKSIPENGKFTLKILILIP